MTWLEEQTGVSDRSWVELIEYLIRAHSTSSEDPHHDETDVTGWIGELTVAIMEKLPAGPVDSNMWAARVLAAILALWYHSIQFAKTQDPRRPIKLRLEATSRLGKWRVAMAKIAMERHADIHAMFPGQSWEDPKDKDATDGTFI